MYIHAITGIQQKSPYCSPWVQAVYKYDPFFDCANRSVTLFRLVAACVRTSFLYFVLFCILKTSELAERPKIRRSMTDVLSQITPKLKRRSQSSAGSLEADNDVHKNAVKSSFLYYKANSGLWVKYWCVLDSAVIYCFNSPEDGTASFSVEIAGSEIRRTSCKSKNFTFDVFHRAADQHHEFAGDSTYVMYAWMRVLKIAAGLGGVRNVNR